jgi:Cd2+/Zn2+-exporting ATPase
VEEIAGRGLKGKIDGAETLVGTKLFLTENGVVTPENQEMQTPYTLVYAATSGEYLGAVALIDELRENGKAVMTALKKAGIYTVMLTGDRADRACAVAEALGMDEYRAELLPDQKLSYAESLKSTGKLAYLGDGINDAPVMKVADCAISMGKLGSSAAVEASDIVLISDDLRALLSSMKIAKKTKKIVWENILFSVAMKFAFMALGVWGVLPLSMAVFADVGVMLLAVLNSLRMRWNA